MDVRVCKDQSKDAAMQIHLSPRLSSRYAEDTSGAAVLVNHVPLSGRLDRFPFLFYNLSQARSWLAAW